MDIQTLLPLLQKFLPLLNGMQMQEPTFTQSQMTTTQNQMTAKQNQNAYNQNINETASLYPNSYIDSPAVTPTQRQSFSQNIDRPTTSNPTPNQDAKTGNMLSQITSLLSSGGGSNSLMSLLGKSNGGDMLSILSSMLGNKKNNSQICELKCVSDYTFD